MNLLDSEVALITGAGSGIGKYVAKLFAENGAAVALVDLHDQVYEVAEKLKAKGFNAIAINCDVTNEDEVKESFRIASKKLGAIDITIACAGIDQISPLHNTTLEQWGNVIVVNLTGVFLTNKYAIKHMLPKRKGSIVNISSIIGSVGQKDITSYAAAKGGVTNQTSSIAVTYANQGIRVNTVSPGYIETALLK